MNCMATPPQAKARCITPQQAEDVAKTFGPVSGTINSDCADPEVETSGKTLGWRLQCRGQLDADVAARFNFDTPQHYTATITFQGRMNKLKRHEEAKPAEPPKPSAEVVLLTEIRDLLKK